MVLGVFSAAASFVFLVAVVADGAVTGQYPGPVSEPSLLATRTTSNSFSSVGFIAILRSRAYLRLTLAQCLPGSGPPPGNYDGARRRVVSAL